MLRKCLSLVGGAVLLASLFTFGTVAPVLGVSGAAYTTDDPAITDPCLNGPTHTTPSVDCNIYDAKTDVWINGGPSNGANQLTDGDYFFAVLTPGGQPDPNDGSAGNLSSPYDAYTDRIFTVSGGHIDGSYAGPHLIDLTGGGDSSLGELIQLAPFNDTTNQGGVYILAICSLANGTPVSASDCKYDAFKVGAGECPDCGAQGNALVIKKDAAGAYKTTYTWDISKSVDKTRVEQIGGTATFTYTVQVTHDAGTVGNVKVSGTITVTNPNAFDATGVTVSDALSDSTVCSVTGGTNATLTSGDNTFAYSCSLSSVPTGQLDNTATATWGAQSWGLIAGSADFTYENISFTNTNADNCTTVTDPVPSGGTSSDNPFPTTVCVGDAGDGGAGTATGDGFTFTYHVSYSVPAHDCVTKTNTATESTDSNTDSVTVTICGPANTGALTMGFWKTTNGQNLIGTYCVNGSYNLGTYLQNLGAGSGPFSNAGTTCSGLKTYVSGILGGANAKNMNTMLKAQMLATALDVWFSGAGWTSTTLNKVKPPSTFLSHNNLGTFNMDTTAVCPMVDNLSTGTATCKNNTPSTNAVTAGAVPTSPMAMQAILDFAATTPAPFNGSVSNSIWYGGNATKEEILKNIFDQFNNGDAFGSF